MMFLARICVFESILNDLRIFELAVNSLCKLTWAVRYQFNLDLLIFFLDNRRHEVSKMTKNV